VERRGWNRASSRTAVDATSSQHRSAAPYRSDVVPIAASR